MHCSALEMRSDVFRAWREAEGVHDAGVYCFPLGLHVSKAGYAVDAIASNEEIAGCGVAIGEGQCD